MKYEVRLPATRGDIVPLMMVVLAKALFRATAGGTDFHRPTYDGSSRAFADDLLQEARLGRLRVCDQWGVPSDADALLSKAKLTGDLVVVSRYLVEPDREKLHRENEPIAPGVWHLGHLDLGPKEVDWTSTHLGVLSTTLKWLNSWAMGRGDEFSISHEGVGWVDERGWVVPPVPLDLDPSPGAPAGAGQRTARTSSTGNLAPEASAVPQGLTYWRHRLYERIRAIDEAHGGRATSKQAIAELKALRDPRMTAPAHSSDKPDILHWRTDELAWASVKSKTVGNALTAARKWLDGTS